MNIFRTAALLLGSALAVVAAPPAAAPSPADGDPAWHILDFWIGNWKVYDAATGQLDGTNRIEPILRGCAIVENWSEATVSGEGKSLFYREGGTWKQVWVTDSGSAKEKRLVAGAPPGGVRFQGEVLTRKGERVLDRTTLTPLPDGRVRQVIEISRDHGATWTTGYDAYYVREP